MMSVNVLSRVLGLVAALSLSTLPIAKATAQAVTLPPPDTGSFSTAFDFTPSQTLITFSGFNVRLQDQRGSSTFNPLGTLPDNFLGGSDPAFIVTSANNLFSVLGTGAGGSKFPDEPFNGSIFILPRTGGTATKVASIPFHVAAAFRAPTELFVSRGEASFTKSAVVRLSLTTKQVQTVIDNIPGATGGVGVDSSGNVYTGIGADPNKQRTGEIRRFTKPKVDQAIQTGVALDFSKDGEFVAQVLSASGLVFDQQGDLWVGGGDIQGGGQKGFIAEVDPKTGAVLRRIDPTDGNPDGGPDTFFSIAISKPIACRLGAVDFFDSTRRFFEINACQSKP
jgi:hypothetical protein